MVNRVQIRAGDFTLYLDCDGLDRVGAGKLAFVLEYWSNWGRLPRVENVVGTHPAGTHPALIPSERLRQRAPLRGGDFLGGDFLEGIF